MPFLGGGDKDICYSFMMKVIGSGSLIDTLLSQGMQRDLKNSEVPHPSLRRQKWPGSGGAARRW